MTQKVIDTLQYHAARLAEVADTSPEAAPELLDAVDLIERAIDTLNVSASPDLTAATTLLNDAVELIDAAPVPPSRILRLVVDAAWDIEVTAVGLAFTRERVTR